MRHVMVVYYSFQSADSGNDSVNIFLQGLFLIEAKLFANSLMGSWVDVPFF